MIDRDKRSILGIGVNVIDYEGAVSRIIKAAEEKKSFSVSALAVHGVMTGVLDITHKYRLNKLDLVTPDGQPVRWALQFLHGEKLVDRVYGPNLTLLTTKAAAEKGLSIYLYGSRQEVLDAFAKNLCEKYKNLKIAGIEASKFRVLSPDEVLKLNKRIGASGADIVFVGLGCPRQEIFAYEHAGKLSRPVIAVGAAFDFHAGLLKQAPIWMQDRGLEWLFRLGTEPRRLWKRYLYLNPLFIYMIVFQKLGLKRKSFIKEEAPTNAVRYG